MLHKLPHSPRLALKSAPRYLVRRGQLWHFRCRVPLDVVAIAGRREVWRTLGGDLPLARQLAAYLAARIGRLWAMARAGTANIEDLIDTWFQRELDNAFKLFRNDTLSETIADEGASREERRELHRAAIASEAEWRIERLGERYRAGIFDDGEPAAREILAQAQGGAVEDSQQLAALAQRITELLGSIEDARLRWTENDLAYRPTISVAGAAVERQQNAQPEPLPEATPKSAERVRTLQEAIEVRLRSYKRDNKPTERMLTQVKSELAILTDAFPPLTPVNEITPKMADRLIDAMSWLPPGWRTDSRLRGNVLERAELASQLSIRTLNPATINGHLTVWRALFDQEKRASNVENNPFAKIRVSSRESTEPAREQEFTESDLQTIFGSPLFRGSRSAEWPYDPGSHPCDNWQFWACLIACFTGARIGEIAQLRPADVSDRAKNADGIWTFSINLIGGKRIKTGRSGVRIVPVHRDLLRIGLLALARDQAAKGAPTLLPSCPKPVGGDPGKTLSKWMTETFLPRLGIKRPGLGFHGFRHTLIGNLMSTGVEEAIAATIAGHKTGKESMTRRYGARGWMKRMENDLNRVVIPEITKIQPRR